MRDRALKALSHLPLTVAWFAGGAEDGAAERSEDHRGLAAGEAFHEQELGDKDGSRRRMLEAEQRFRRVLGYRDLAKLAVATERHLTANVPSPTAEEAATLVTA